MSEQQEEWGPWIEHDGKGCPCLGFYVRFETDVKISNFVHGQGVIIAEKMGEYIPRVIGPSWLWESGFAKVLRYRIRKPRALIELRNMVENMPELVE